jgi:hypothetical protein
MGGGRSNEDHAMHRIAIAAAGFALSLAAGLAAASEPPAAPAARPDRCESAPREPFRPEADLAAVVERLGYRVERVGTEAGCYGVRAVDRRGKRVDMRFEGATLRMVSRYSAPTESEVIAQR